MSDPVVLLSTGDVVGPAGGVTDNSMVLFSGTSGKLIKGNNAQVTSAGLALLDDIDANAQLATLGLTTTQPQFDNSVKQATTEFVQRALGNASSFQELAANYTITAADAGKTFLLGALGIVITFPDSTTLPSGWEVTILSAGSASCVLGGSTFVSSRGEVVTANNGFSLKINARKLANSYRVSHWGDGAAILAGNGYQKLPSGLIIQWGVAVAGATVTLPIAFPNAMLQGLTSDSGVICAAGGIDTMTTTNFKLYSRDFNGTYSAFTMRWIAIGY